VDEKMAPTLAYKTIDKPTKAFEKQIDTLKSYAFASRSSFTKISVLGESRMH
jgi:hypothetical protein